ncbi:MAG: RNA 2',3'-cyclic phosphodiesterase [Candidatus Omnitrophica bacterium]|nr:RNA 2',3'-cyclic phosphodiesterase [Candidatus Omnitrophota bacterium]
MRTFIAIELPKEIKDELTKLQDQLKLSNADVKWVAPENIHLTIKFLGEINEEKLCRISEVIENCAKDKSPYLIRINSLGVFPNMNSPRVIWVGLDKGNQETEELAKSIEENLEKLGIPKEKRPFSSHITIARVRSMKNREQLIEALKKLENVFVGNNLEWNVKKVILFKSTLTPKGPTYEALKETILTTT